MATESTVKIRRGARIAQLAGMLALLASGSALAQLPIQPPAPVTVGSVLPFNHGATGTWGQVYSLKTSPDGSVVFMDSALSEIFQLAPGASEPTLVAGPVTSGASNCSALEVSGSYWNAAIAFDAWDNLYVTDRYGSAVQYCRVPYQGGTWKFSSADVWAGPQYVTTTGGTQTSGPMSPQDLAVADNGTTFYMSTAGNQTPANIYSFTVNQAGTISNLTPLVTNLLEFANSIAVDHAGNLFFIENIYGSTLNTRVPGIREIPAGTSGINAASGQEASLTQLVGHSDQYTGIGGISFDKQGNLYFSSVNNSNYNGNVSGVFMIPNEGTPTAPNLNWNDTVMVSPVYAGHPVLADPRGFLWIATGGSGNWSPGGTNGPACDSGSTTQIASGTCLASTVVVWKPGMASIGASSVGTAGGAAQIKSYAHSSSDDSLTLTANNSFVAGETVTITASSSDPLSPLNNSSFYVLPMGLSNTSFEIATTSLKGSGTTSATASVTGTVYYAFNKATTPQKLAISQVGSSFAMVPNPSPDTTVTPPVLPCTAGTAYPAFNPTELTAPNFSWCAAYLQLTPATAGTVEGELQLLDANNNIIAGSNVYLSGLGQGAAVSLLASPTTQSIAKGLNQPLQVAADSRGNLYVADEALKAIEVYPANASSPTSGTIAGANLGGPTGVAVDGAGDLYIGDKGNIIEIPSINGSLDSALQTTIASGLGNELNLAVDAAGDVFAADTTNKKVIEISNPESALLQQDESLQTLGASAGFAGPTAIATDTSGNVWVADGNNLWEITMPFGVATEVLTGKLQGPVTGLSVDPSGSVFVSDASGLWWIPYQASSAGLNFNGAVQVASSFGSGSSAPEGVALDNLQNVYVSYGSGSSAGLTQIGTNGVVNMSANQEINPNVPVEYDAQFFNLGNLPLTIGPYASDAISGTNASDFSVAAGTEIPPGCTPSASAPAGTLCTVGINILAPSAGPATASVAILSNAVNASAGTNIALSANVQIDNRPVSQVGVTIKPDTTDTGCAGSIYPGCEIVTVTVTSSAGTPTGSVLLSVPGSGSSQAQQTAALTNGVATFKLTGLNGGTYNVLADYAGTGTEGSTANSCSPANSVCFAGGAMKTTFTINPAPPAVTIGPPVTVQGCLNTTATGCGLSSSIVTVYLGNTFVSSAQSAWITASITSSVGTPTGTITFCSSYSSGKCTPADPTQGNNGAMPLSGNGVVNFPLVNLATGVYNLTAVYSGDVNYAQQVISVGAFQVISPSLQITATPATTSITAGTPVQVTLNLMPLVGFNKNVSLECVSASLPKYTECTFAYPNAGEGNVTVAGTTPSTIVVTLNTDVPVNGGTASLARQAPWSLAGLFGLGLLGLMAGRKRLNRYLTLVCVTTMFAGLFVGLSACTNAGYSTPPAAPSVTTPNGTYNIQIISYDPTTLQQDSLTTPLFTLPTTVQ